jgi:hypothetical protein
MNSIANISGFLLFGRNTRFGARYCIRVLVVLAGFLGFWAENEKAAGVSRRLRCLAALGG